MLNIRPVVQCVYLYRVNYRCGAEFTRAITAAAREVQFVMESDNYWKSSSEDPVSRVNAGWPVSPLSSDRSRVCLCTSDRPADAWCLAQVLLVTPTMKNRVSRWFDEEIDVLMVSRTHAFRSNSVVWRYSSYVSLARLEVFWRCLRIQ